MAAAVAKSNLFGINKPEQALALMLVAQAEGRHPAIVARDYHIIEGKPSLTADAMLSRFLERGGRVEWTEYTDERVTGVFTPAGQSPLAVSWDTERARRAGLLGRKTWQKYPRQMRRGRVVTEAVRTVDPGALSGTYTPDEIGDFAPAPAPTSPKVIDAEVVDAPQLPPTEGPPPDDGDALLTARVLVWDRATAYYALCRNISAQIPRQDDQPEFKACAEMVNGTIEEKGLDRTSAADMTTLAEHFENCASELNDARNQEAADAST
jgi:hypothetical protein